MDWNAVIERNREALKRILASLVAMAGLRGRFAPEAQSCRAGSTTTGGEGRDAAGGGGDPAGRHSEGRPTLPRHLHRAVLRLLRPAEAAARRLVIVAARGMVVEAPRPRPRKPDPTAGHAALRALGIAIVMSPADHARAAVGKSRRPHREARSEAAPRTPVLPLFDPPQYPFRVRRRTVAPHAAPRILSFDGARPHRLPPPPSPNDPIDARRLALRLQAVASALDDLPGHARRFARWKVRVVDAAGAQKRSRDAVGAQHGQHRAAGRFRRLSPLRPGRPPGLSAASRRRPSHEIHEVLADLQYFAFKAQQPDTS